MQEFWEKGLLHPLSVLAQQVLVVLPNVLAMSIIFAAGLLVAWTASQTLERLLRVVGLDRLSDRLGVTSALLRGGVKTDPSRLVGQAAYWIVMIFATVAALGALNLQPINDVAKSFLPALRNLAHEVNRAPAENAGGGQGGGEGRQGRGQGGRGQGGRSNVVLQLLSGGKLDVDAKGKVTGVENDVATVAIQARLTGKGTNEEMCYWFALAYPAGALADGGLLGTFTHGENACLGL